MLLGLALACRATATDTAEDWPETPACDDVRSWPTVELAREQALVHALNAMRETGYACAQGQPSRPAAPLLMSPALHCAARVQGEHLLASGTLDHQGPQAAQTPALRAAAANYRGIALHELLARNVEDAADVVLGLRDDELPCGALVDDEADDVGVGLARNASGSRNVWVVMLGRAGAF